MESLDDKVKRLDTEQVRIEPYNEEWPLLFCKEKEHLSSCLPRNIIKRIEHFGSTSIPNMPAKSIIDILVEVSTLEETKLEVVPILESQGYEYLWRPMRGDNVPPFYAWFIKRNLSGVRTHHIHMVERHFEQWERLLFRDYLVENSSIAHEYRQLKLRLAAEFPNDRTRYTEGKTTFIKNVTKIAKEYYAKA